MNQKLQESPETAIEPQFDQLPGYRRPIRTLPCPLTDDERTEKSKDLARHHLEIGRLTDEKKAIVDEYKHKISTHESKVGMLSTQIHAGFESREIQCWWEMNVPETGLKTLYRSDTCERVEVEKMNQEDMQFDIVDAEMQHQEDDGDSEM